MRRFSDQVVIHPILCRPLCGLVGLDGLEPSTSRLSGARSSHLSYRPFYSKAYLVQSTLPCLPFGLHRQFFVYGVAVNENGGDEGNRTLDPLLAGQVLSQLSYTPEKSEE